MNLTKETTQPQPLHLSFYYDRTGAVETFTRINALNGSHNEIV